MPARMYYKIKAYYNEISLGLWGRYGDGIWAEEPKFKSRQRVRFFFPHHSVQTSFRAHAAYTMGAVGSFNSVT
jgi:hypothetical protein